MSNARFLLFSFLLTSIAVGDELGALPNDLTKLPEDLTSVSIEELINIPVSSVSRRDQKQWMTAAATYVITHEDIRRSGLTSIPELLRLVPGLHVAQLSSSVWSVSARGFSGRYTDKLLVMIDRRSIYSPRYGGVDWQLHDLMLEDVERIEVVRGPGATMWGANAMNGVIHIITKSALNTVGGLVSATAGTENKTLSGFRYGGRIGKSAAYRVFSRYRDQQPLPFVSEENRSGPWRLATGGFRIDWDRSEQQSFSFLGGVYDGRVRNEISIATLSPPFQARLLRREVQQGGNLLGRWRQAPSESSEFRLQVYYDRANSTEYDDNSHIDIADLDFQHSFRPHRRHEILWGAGFRSTSTRSDDTFPLTFLPRERTDGLLTAFIQDEMRVINDSLWLTVGMKVEHNSYTGREFQPGVRLLWTASKRQTLWASVARAVSTPSRTRSDIRINAAAFPYQRGSVGIVSILGSPEYRSPAANTLETGYRFQPTRTLALDAVSFYTGYKYLQTLEPGAPFVENIGSEARTVFPTRFANKMRGETYGAEIAGNWTPVSRWKLSGSYSNLQIRTHRSHDSRDADAEAIEGYTPNHQLSMRSLLDMGRLEFDAIAFHVGRLHSQPVPSYLRADVRVGWRFRTGVELSVSAQNILDNRHPEFLQSDGRMRLAEVRRSIQARALWRFGGD